MTKILIVEDDKALNSAYQMILEHEGYEVKTAFDGKDGLELATSFKPDIILLDLLMPIMGGISFLEHYNPGNKHPDVRVIVLSNMGDYQLVDQARTLGAYKYIVKAHTSPGQLARVINHLTGKTLAKKDNSTDSA